MSNQSFEIVNNILCEIYPYSLNDLINHERDLNFEWLSRNKNIKWSVEIITEFYKKWNWKAFDENAGVFDKVTLGLFFPEMLQLPKCECWLREDFCEDKNCSINLDKFLNASTLMNLNPKLFMKVDMMIQSGLIDESMIEKFYVTQNPNELLKFSIPYK